MLRAKEIIHKIYPVLFADEFQLNESNFMESSCFDANRKTMRTELLMSALREGVKGKPQPRRTLEDMTTFRPFNVRETKWDVWDVKESKYEQYLNLHQQRGMFDITQLMMPGAGAPPPQPRNNLRPNLNSVPSAQSLGHQSAASA